MTKEVIRYLSLFSGIGGFELGIQNSDVEMECVGFAEIDKYAESIYLGRFPEHKNFGDVTKIKTEDLPDFDFLVGGFPCQAFSHAGKRRGFDDTRGTLFFEIARILKDKRPRYFLLENVRGLLSHNKGKTFQRILEVLSDLGYNVKWEIFNSKDHGVPQRRERIFIKGYSRRECAGEVLSFRGSDKEDSCQVKRELIVDNVKLPVLKRKYDVDVQRLQELLRNSKKGQGLSNNDIAKELNLPETHVAHWFRTDKHFSIPTADIWHDLKKILKITDSSFDKPITEFVEEDGKYDMGNRIYSEQGLAPTLKCSNDGELIKEHDRKLKCINPEAGQSQKIYEIDGLATTLSANGGGQGGKTGLYKVKR